jgi:hypothetical protein
MAKKDKEKLPKIPKLPKNIPYNVYDDDDLFDNSLGDDVIDGIEVAHIDLDTIGNNAVERAKSMVENLTSFYYDEEFIKKNPEFKNRVDNQVEHLRILLKMRDTDEELHDMLIKSIMAKPTNASLFVAQQKMQSTMTQILSQINSTVEKLTTLIKSYQSELNFKKEQEQLRNETNPDEPVSTDEVNNTHRGSKAFIQDMENKEKLFTKKGE